MLVFFSPVSEIRIRIRTVKPLARGIFGSFAALTFVRYTVYVTASSKEESIGEVRNAARRKILSSSPSPPPPPSPPTPRCFLASYISPSPLPPGPRPTACASSCSKPKAARGEEQEVGNTFPPPPLPPLPPRGDFLASSHPHHSPLPPSPPSSLPPPQGGWTRGEVIHFHDTARAPPAFFFNPNLSSLHLLYAHPLRTSDLLNRKTAS